VLEKVEAVPRRLQHTHCYGDQQQTNIRVRWEMRFTTAVGLHLADTEEAPSALSTAHRQVMGIQRMNNGDVLCAHIHVEWQS
jgi:hypothetical protein